ncbi:gpW family head-tail joining protein [Spartinivicinus marinus]|nr:gpW family head-tail joining protein [Spartinivicinus marinus]MCX4025178.1 gpW family head-tail joining protein [Spartinivicinus marinus]
MTHQQRLEEAKAALHKLQTGSLRATVRDSEGNSVTFHAPQQLEHYIKSLEAELNGKAPRQAFWVTF